MTLPNAPAAERNKVPLLEALTPLLPAVGRVLEIASGTGQHVAYFAAALPWLHWLPTDASAKQLEVIGARTAGQANVEAPRLLDVHDPWPAWPCDTVLAVNLLHVAPESATVALCRGAAGVLETGGLLCVYGPFRRDGRHSSDGNRAFDRALRADNPAWGLRDLETLLACGRDHGLSRETVIDMPANNLLVVLGREG